MAKRSPQYDELKLRFEKAAAGSYTVLASAADGRVGRGSFVPPVTDDELDDFVRGVGLVRRGRRSQYERMEEIETLGSKLFSAVVRAHVADVYQAARTVAEGKGRGLRIALCLSGAPELMRLPWEFLYKRPRFLSQSIYTPLIRSLDLESVRRPQHVELLLRILGIVSSPSGYPELDAHDERRKLEHALGRLRSNGLVEVHWLEHATLTELDRRIAEPDEIHILHYIGHGAYDEATEAGILVLETAQGRAHDVSGRQLGSILQDEQSLRLVVLNSCEGARTSRIDPFSGVAASLVEFEIPAVIGMQFEITDEAAIAFSDSLYTVLAQGLPVDAALGPTRRAIAAAQREAEFATPVLFLRGSDAELFDVRVRTPQDSHTTVEEQARREAEEKARREVGESERLAATTGGPERGLEQQQARPPVAPQKRTALRAMASSLRARRRRTVVIAAAVLAVPLIVLVIPALLISANNTTTTATQFVVSATQGWQQTPVTVTAGESYKISYVTGTWTVDGRLYANGTPHWPYVGPGGYSTDIDQQIFAAPGASGCKVVGFETFGTLLLQIGNSPPRTPSNTNGTPVISRVSGPLSLRINDDCLGDNAGSITVDVSASTHART